MKYEEMQEILRLHSMWLRGEDGGARANLTGADLSRADLSEANLSGAVLSLADLSAADLRWANLSEADLSEADLSEADLSRADLSETNLRKANLIRADLSGANLSLTYLCEADLREADLRDANLCDSDLRGADISGADLRWAIDGAVCRMDFGGWSICIRATYTSIECQRHLNEQWLAWSPDDVAHMHADARDWWADHGDVVKAAIKCVMKKAAKEKEAT